MKTLKKAHDSVLYRSAHFISMLALLRHRERELTSNQVEQFEGWSLNRSEGLEHLNKVLRSEFDQEFLETRGMWSEHLVLFSSLSLSGVNFKKILEIGTHKGETTRVLHRLFPDSEITTWDLPTDVAKHIEIYTYSDSDQIIRERETNIGQIHNIHQIQRDSCNLVFDESSYDLIWLDGAHGYPVCTIDITNAVRMVAPGGLIVCDDVYKYLKKSDGMYDSTSTFETLEAFRKCGILEYSLLRKRLAARFNLWKSQTKYIAVAKVREHSNSLAKS
jgi:hypothetical protein